MSFHTMSGDTRNQPPQQNRIHFANVGDGDGLFRGINGSIVEMKSLKIEGASLVSTDETITISIPRVELPSYVADFGRINTSLEAHRRQIRDLETRCSSLGAQIANMKPYKLPAHLERIADLMPFDGSVLLAEKGVWKVGNLRQMFEIVTNKIERIEFNHLTHKPKFTEIEREIGILKNLPPPQAKRDWVPYILWAGTVIGYAIRTMYA